MREGDDDAVGDEQVDKAYENLGRVYDYYHETFGYDSYDGQGAPVVGIVNVCDGGTSSYWSDDSVHFAPGAGDALDTAAHEFTHGVTANTAGLRYECQSGALNESISDIMAWNLDPRPDLRRGPQRRRPGRPRRRHDPRLPLPRALRPADDRRRLSRDAQRPLRRLGRRAHQQRHPQPRLVRAGRPRGPRPGRADRLARPREHLQPDSDFEDFRTMLGGRTCRPRRRGVDGVDAASRPSGSTVLGRARAEGCSSR